MKPPWVPLALAALVVTLAACGSPTGTPTRMTHQLVDTSGASVGVPLDIRYVGEQFPAHTVTDIMLGAGEKIAGIPPNVRTLPFLRKVYPRIDSIPELFTADGTANSEKLLEQRVDVVFGFDPGLPLKPFADAGISAVVVGFQTFPQLAQSVTLTGQVLGDAAARRAQDYVDYLDRNVALVHARLAGLPDTARPSVAHIASFPPLVVDGRGSSTAMWLDAAGATNAMSEVNGSHAAITPEELLRQNPDVLIIQAPGGDQGLAAGTGQSVVDSLSTLPVWRDLKAVREHRVYLNPQGAYPWERASPEEALQVLWAAKVLHPDRFADVDVRAEARTFYQRFFGYSLTDTDLDQMFQNG